MSSEITSEPISENRSDRKIDFADSYRVEDKPNENETDNTPTKTNEFKEVPIKQNEDEAFTGVSSKSLKHKIKLFLIE
jgi:hypothetical protein